MQRLGFCKAAILLSPLASSSSDLADQLKDKLQGRSVRVPHSRDLDEWLTGRGREATPGDSGGLYRQLPLQHYYAWQHPSRVGWLSRGGFSEYAEYFPRRLGFLDEAFGLTEIGDLLARVLMPASEREGFEKGEAVGNILVLDFKQQVLFLRQLLAADGDFLIPYVGSLASRFGSSSYTYLEAGLPLPEICREVARNFARVAYTSDDRETLDKLDATADKIQEQIDEAIESKGSGSRREQTSIPRLEWLVDLELAKRQPSAGSTRVFSLTPQGITFAEKASSLYRQFMTTKYPNEVVPEILDNHFYSLVSHIYLDARATARRPGNLIDYIDGAYRALSRMKGYYVLKPLLLLSNLYALESDPPVFVEYSTAAELLEKAYQDTPERFSYSADRFATDYQIRIQD